MRNSLTQPSLSRDFILLSAAVLLVLALISGWVTYKTYENHFENIELELNKEAIRIERTLSAEIGSASYMLASLGRQIVVDDDRSHTKIARLLKAFDDKDNIYSLFSWIDNNNRIVVSSNKGVLDEPVDISDRDFIKESVNDSWKMHIGRPIEGRVSERWVIPVAMGITDYTGKFIGIISLSLDINVLTGHISDIVRKDGISFAVLSRDLVTLSEVSQKGGFVKDNFPIRKLTNIDLDKNPAGFLSKGNPAWGRGVYSYYRTLEHYPYVVLMGYDADKSDEMVKIILWARLLQIFAIALFFVIFLWMVRVRVINPVLAVTSMLSSVVKGKKFDVPAKNAPIEIEELVRQVQQVERYIDENKRIENELRNKMFYLKKAKENAEFNMRSKSEFLAYIAQEMRVPINNIIGFAQVFKDQIYGQFENRKYKQYASDIFVIANQLIGKMQDVLLYSKIENGYTKLQEKPVDIGGCVNSALRQVADRLHDSKTSVKVNIEDNIPYIQADSFRIQQAIINIVLHMIDAAGDGDVININAEVINGGRQFFILSMCCGGGSCLSEDKLFNMVDRLFNINEHFQYAGNGDGDRKDLRVDLAKTIISLHGGALGVDSSDDEKGSYIIFFPAGRFVFKD